MSRPRRRRGAPNPTDADGVPGADRVDSDRAQRARSGGCARSARPAHAAVVRRHHRPRRYAGQRRCGVREGDGHRVPVRQGGVDAGPAGVDAEVDRQHDGSDRQGGGGQQDRQRGGEEPAVTALKKSVGDAGGDTQADDVAKKLGTIREARESGAVPSGVAQDISAAVLRSLPGTDAAGASGRDATTELVRGIQPDAVTSLETEVTTEGDEKRKITVGEGSGGGGFLGTIQRTVADMAKGQIPPAVVAAGASVLTGAVKAKAVEGTASMVSDAIKGTVSRAVEVIGAEISEIRKTAKLVVKGPRTGAVVLKKYPDPMDYYPVTKTEKQATREVRVSLENLADDGPRQRPGWIHRHPLD